jgi:hypothetical protein
MKGLGSLLKVEMRDKIEPGLEKRVTRLGRGGGRGVRGLQDKIPVSGEIGVGRGNGGDELGELSLTQSGALGVKIDAKNLVGMKVSVFGGDLDAAHIAEKSRVHGKLNDIIRLEERVLDDDSRTSSVALEVTVVSSGMGDKPGDDPLDASEVEGVRELDQVDLNGLVPLLRRLLRVGGDRLGVPGNNRRGGGPKAVHRDGGGMWDSVPVALLDNEGQASSQVEGESGRRGRVRHCCLEAGRAGELEFGNKVTGV